MSRRAQPYRGNAPRGASPVLDAMLAGRASTQPSATLMQSTQQSAVTPQRGGGVRIPRVSARSRNLRAQWPAQKTQR